MKIKKYNELRNWYNKNVLMTYNDYASYFHKFYNEWMKPDMIVATSSLVVVTVISHGQDNTYNIILLSEVLLYTKIAFITGGLYIRATRHVP